MPGVTANAEISLQAIYQDLLGCYGHQDWWPAQTPFEVMVGAILTQNTAWSNVEKALANLQQASALDPEIILDLPQPQLAAMLRPSGYFNLKARRLRNLCQWLLEQGGIGSLSERDDDELRTALLSVNGVGPESADDIVLYAFQRPVFVIDAYTRRLFSRLELIAGDEGYEALRHFFEARLPADVALYKDYHAQIVIHAKQHCRKRPACKTCCLLSLCPYGQQQTTT